MTEIDWTSLEAADVIAVDCETSGLFVDDGAQVSCVSLAWRDAESGELRSLGIPFDQGVRVGKHVEGMTEPQKRAFYCAMEAEQTRERVLAEMAGKKRQDTKVYAELEAQAQMLGRVSWVGEDESVWERLMLLLSESALVMHNAKFDVGMLWRGAPRGWRSGNLGRRVVWDTMLCAKIIEPVEAAGLDACAQRLELFGKVGVDRVARWLSGMKLPKFRYDLAPWELIHEYAVVDAELTLQVYEDQLAYFGHQISEEVAPEAEQEWQQFEREMDLMRALVAMEARGIGYVSEKSLDLAEEADKEAAALELQMLQELDLLREMSGSERAELTLPQMKAWWTAEGFADAFARTERGGLSATAEVLEDLAVEGRVPYVVEWKRLTDLRRMSSMYYRGYAEKVGADGRLRCSYRQWGTRSGRLSVERVNLQAIPRGKAVRGLLSAAEGHGLWALDLSQAELRVAARYAECQGMLRALREGLDMHAQTALAVVPGAGDAWREGAGKDSEAWKAARSLGKQANFGCLFGIGPERFRALIKKNTGVLIELSEAERIVWGWRKLYPEFVQAWGYWQGRAERDEWVPQLLGGKYEVRSYFDWEGRSGRGGLREYDEARTAWNRVVQGSIGQFVRLWLTDLWQRGLGVVLTVHDSVYLEVEDWSGEGEAVAQKEAARAAAWALELFGIEIPVDIECYTRGMRHSAD